MAKAKQIEGLNCDADAAPTAAKVLSVRFEEILLFHAAALEPDGVDGVHDMRVASRRFRSALRDFGPLFDKKAVKPLKKHVKKVADALGEVRDHDVAIEALASLQEKAPNDVIAAGIELLTGSRRSERSEAHANLIKQVTIDRLADLRHELGEILEQVDEDNEKAQTFRSFAANAIERAFERYLERSASIYAPFNDQALHKLRLAAKRFRYALELFDDCWNDELKPFSKHISKIQSSLGQVHDSSEWIGYLSESARTAHGPDRQTAAWLISEFVTLRTDEYLKALELWNEWLASDLTSRLRTIVPD
jgi:CHAD domain-containing protein